MIDKLIKTGIIAGVVLFIVCIFMVVIEVPGNFKKRNQRFVDQGKEAFELGVDSRSNPYIEDPTMADLWLRGWMDGKRESLKAEKEQ